MEILELDNSLILQALLVPSLATKDPIMENVQTLYIALQCFHQKLQLKKKEKFI